MKLLVVTCRLAEQRCFYHFAPFSFFFLLSPLFLSAGKVCPAGKLGNFFILDELGIDLSQLKGWSRKVADDFKAINAPYSSAEEELATVVAENNRLVSDLRKEIADLKALAATNARTTCHLETQLQKSDALALNGTSVPLIASGGVDSAVAGTSRPAGGTIRRREPSPPRSPGRNVRQRTA